MESIIGWSIECHGGRCWDRHYYSQRDTVGAFFKPRFKASNNEAEYEALLAGLRAILEMGARDMEIYSDSRLVINHV